MISQFECEVMGNMKKHVSILLILSLFCCLYGSTFADEPTDLSETKYYINGDFIEKYFTLFLKLKAVISGAEYISFNKIFFHFCKINRNQHLANLPIQLLINYWLI